MERLTGRTRHRPMNRAFGPPKLVLQVERTYLHDYCIGGHIDTETVTDWRDATVEDLTTLELSK